jgi:hypothetical protein
MGWEAEYEGLGRRTFARPALKDATLDTFTPLQLRCSAVHYTA